MTVPSLVTEADRVDEPQEAKDYSEVLNRVAAERRPVIVRRNGKDVVAVIPIDYLPALEELLAWEQVEKRAARIDWERAVQTLRPPQAPTSAGASAPADPSTPPSDAADEPPTGD